MSGLFFFLTKNNLWYALFGRKMSFALALHSGEICRDDLIVKPEVMLVAWHVLLCSKWSFWCSVKICISASLPRQTVSSDCSIMAGAAVIFTSHLPFLAHAVDS